eukprot:1154915-Pelagomonas_calceolata.AAC.5
MGSMYGHEQAFLLSQQSGLKQKQLSCLNLLPRGSTDKMKYSSQGEHQRSGEGGPPFASFWPAITKRLRQMLITGAWTCA